MSTMIPIATIGTITATATIAAIAGFGVLSVVTSIIFKAVVVVDVCGVVSGTFFGAKVFFFFRATSKIDVSKISAVLMSVIRISCLLVIVLSDWFSSDKAGGRYYKPTCH